MTNHRSVSSRTPNYDHLVRATASKDTQERLRERAEKLMEDAEAEKEAEQGVVVVPESYRALAVVPTADLSELPPRADKGCPACWYALKDFLKEFFCRGGRYGFLWLRRCRIREPHMHQHCTRCGATWIAQPHSSARYV